MKLSKKIIVSAFLAISCSVFSQETRKVLFLGNSYTYANDLPQIVATLATNTGDVLIYDSNLIGGYTLQDHFDSTLSKNKILSDNWDYIVLQEQSQRPAFAVPLAFFNGFLELKGYIKQNKSRNQYKSTIDKYKVRHIVSFFVGTVFTDECSPKKREYQQENGYNRS